MIVIHQRGDDGVVRQASDTAIALTQSGLVWIDLLNPSQPEEECVEQALGIEVLTHAERLAIEESARFYRENDALYLTATLMGRREDGPFRSDAVTFIMTRKGTLVTVRRINPRAFATGAGRASARIADARHGGDVMVALFDGCVERIADVLQESTHEATELSGQIFAEHDDPPNLRRTLRTLGRLGGLAGMAHDSLSSMQRAVAYATHAGEGIDPVRLSALRHDIEELERAVEAFQSRLTFLQEGVIGLVGETQNNTLKALSLATIAFVPPTLIASIFGMNFTAMHWFEEPWGPRAAFLLMLLAPAALLAIAKWRRWF